MCVKATVSVVPLRVFWIFYSIVMIVGVTIFDAINFDGVQPRDQIGFSVAVLIGFVFLFAALWRVVIVMRILVSVTALMTSSTLIMEYRIESALNSAACMIILLASAMTWFRWLTIGKAER